MIKCQTQEWSYGSIIVTGTFSFTPVKVLRGRGRKPVDSGHDPEIIDAYRRGGTLRSIAMKYGIPVGRVRRILIRSNAYRDEGRVMPVHPLSSPSRDADMVDMYRSGSSLAEISAKYGITRERVRQIVAKSGVRPDEGGRLRLRKEARENGTRKSDIYRAEVETRRKDKLERLGVDAETFDAAKKDGRWGKFRQDRVNHKRLGHEWTMTFAEWLNVWREAGHETIPESMTFRMDRINPDGPYSAQNVQILPLGESLGKAVSRAAAKRRNMGHGGAAR